MTLWWPHLFEMTLSNGIKRTKQRPASENWKQQLRLHPRPLKSLYHERNLDWSQLTIRCDHWPEPGPGHQLNFFLFPFVKDDWFAPNTFIFHYSSRTLEGLFELTRYPSRALNLPRVLLSIYTFASRITDKKGQSQVCRARPGGPRTQSRTAYANLDCAFVENALFTPILDCEK